MTHDPKTANIEADIAEERDALAKSLSDLTSRLSPENLASSVGDTLKSQGDELGQAVVRGAKENPAALALVGAGLAWLLLSKSTDKSDDAATPASYDARPHAAVGGFRDAPSGAAEFEARVAAAEAALSAPHEADDPSLFDRASGFARKTAAEMRATFHDGTAELGDLARERVVEARRKALIAQERAEHQARAMKAGAKGVYFDNPLLVGAGVAALGALAALALPRTKVEDDTFGAHRDTLVAHADAVLQEELSRAKAAATAAADEARKMAEEAVEEVPSGDEAVAKAESTLRDAGERIKARARDANAH